MKGVNTLIVNKATMIEICDKYVRSAFTGLNNTVKDVVSSENEGDFIITIETKDPVEER